MNAELTVLESNQIILLSVKACFLNLWKYILIIANILDAPSGTGASKRIYPLNFVFTRFIDMAGNVTNLDRIRFDFSMKV